MIEFEKKLFLIFHSCLKLISKIIAISMLIDDLEYHQGKKEKKI